nr:reverse transcriptase domain, reverse transcriptase zinc-binding domain protein [Tanacetum cinerariifolium]
MLYCIARSERYNLAYFIAKGMELFTKQPRLILPHGMLLTSLFNHVISESLELSNDHYVLCDRVMYPLTAQQERKTRKDYGTRRGRFSTSSSFTFGQPSSSHPNDDDNDGNEEVTIYIVLYGIGVNDEDVSSMAHNVGCISGALSFTYLGLPIGSNMNSIASWKMVINRFQSRLSSWKANLLSFGGRLTLIESVLESLGIYYFSIYRAPQMVLHDLERIRSNFFWGVADLEFDFGKTYGWRMKGGNEHVNQLRQPFRALQNLSADVGSSTGIDDTTNVSTLPKEAMAVQDNVIDHVNPLKNKYPRFSASVGESNLRSAMNPSSETEYDAEENVWSGNLVGVATSRFGSNSYDPSLPKGDGIRVSTQAGRLFLH